MHKLITILFCLLCFSLTTYSQVVASETTFWYSVAHADEDYSTICLLALNGAEEEDCIEIPAFGSYAVSPDYLHIAFRANSNGQLFLFNIMTKEIKLFDLCQPFQEFLWDEHYRQSGTLLWSPDGRFLTFTGVMTMDCRIDDQAEVYIYDVENDDLKLLTENVPIIRSLVSPASWSPDSEWLVLYGAWSLNDDGLPQFGSALISPDGENFRQISSGRNTCRLIWSSDMAWLASDTGCFERIGNPTDLMFIPFSLQPLETITTETVYIDEIVSPLYLNSPMGSWVTTYHSPIWTSAQTVVAYRRVVPISFGYLTPEQTQSYSSQGLVRIDLETHSEVLIVEHDDTSGQITKLGDWFFIRQDDVYNIVNPILDKNLIVPITTIPCVIPLSVRISSVGDYLAVVDHCNPETARLTIYDTTASNAVMREIVFDTNTIKPLGFSN